jgi:hypothetical protein
MIHKRKRAISYDKKRYLIENAFCTLWDGSQTQLVRTF